MKKLLTFGLSILLVFSNLAFPIFAEENSNASISSEERILCNAIIEDEFANDCVIVGLTLEASKSMQNLTVEALQIEGIESIESDSGLSAKAWQFVEDYWAAQKISQKAADAVIANNNSSENPILLNPEAVRKTYKLTLVEKTKANVLQIIHQLEDLELDFILYAQPSYIVQTTSINTNDALINNQQDILNLIQLEQAWEITTGSSSVQVGIIDTGIDGSHPEFAERINSTLSKSFHNVQNDPLTVTYFHGTGVAGIIGANANNSQGIAGVAQNIKLISLKVSNSSTINMGYVVSAIEYASSNGIKILNISLGYQGTFPAELDNRYRSALAAYGGLIVCAAGNENTNIDTTPAYPAAYNYNNIITVSASTNGDNKLSSSNYGETSVDLFAPGESIYTTIANGGYSNNFSGTSAAAPFVTGVAALIYSLPNNHFTPQQVKHFILDNVDTNSNFSGKCVSGGRLNAYKAVSAAANFVDGKYCRIPETNDVFAIAGGAPIYVDNWPNIGGVKPVTNITVEELNMFRQYPVDGTFVYTSNNLAYVIAGGAPIYISNWQNIGISSPSATLIDYTAINNAGNGGKWNHLRQQPEDGTYVYTNNNCAYVIAGGAPIYINSWQNVGVTSPVATLIDYAAIDNAGTGGVWNHLNQQPTDGTYLYTINNLAYVMAGGAPMQISDWSNIGLGIPSAVLVDYVAINNAGNGSVWNHLNPKPRDNTYVRITGGTIFRYYNGQPYEIYSIDELPNYQSATVVDMTMHYAADFYDTAYVWNIDNDDTRTINLSLVTEGQQIYIQIISATHSDYHIYSSNCSAHLYVKLRDDEYEYIDESNNTSGDFGMDVELLAGREYYLVIYEIYGDTVDNFYVNANPT